MNWQLVKRAWVYITCTATAGLMEIFFWLVVLIVSSIGCCCHHDHCGDWLTLFPDNFGSGRRDNYRDPSEVPFQIFSTVIMVVALVGVVYLVAAAFSPHDKPTYAQTVTPVAQRHIQAAKPAHKTAQKTAHKTVKNAQPAKHVQRS